MKIQKMGSKVVYDFNPKQDKATALSSKITMLVKYAIRRGRPVVFLCIGTDTVVGDALGPLVGTSLVKKFHSDLQVYGTLENPVDAKNVEQTIEDIKQEFENAFVIAIDASFSSLEERKGLVTFSMGGLKPGAATRDDLPEVGDLAVRGIVAGGKGASLFESRIRLADITVQADFIAKGLYKAYKNVLADKDFNQAPVAV